MFASAPSRLLGYTRVDDETSRSGNASHISIPMESSSPSNPSRAFISEKDIAPVSEWRLEDSNRTTVNQATDSKRITHTISAHLKRPNSGNHSISPASFTASDRAVSIRLRGNDDGLSVDVEVRTLDESHPGTRLLDLHTMELHKTPHNRFNNLSKTQHVDFSCASSIWVHMPYSWSLNVEIYSQMAEKRALKTIISYSISGDGLHAATLSVTGTLLILELWDLKEPTSFAHSDSSSTIADNNQTTLRSPPLPPADRYHPHRSGWYNVRVMEMDRLRDSFQDHIFTISVSRSGSQVALLDASDKVRNHGDDHRSNFTVPQREPRQHTVPIDQVGILFPSKAYEKGTQLPERFFGHGKSHTTSALFDSNELFIACDGKSVQIFSVHGVWTRLYIIDIEQSNFSGHIDAPPSWNLISGLQGKHFVLDDQVRHTVSVWDIEDGSVASFYCEDTATGLNRDTNNLHHHRPSCSIVGFSSDGSKVAICRDRTVSIHMVAFGTLLGSYTVSRLQGKGIITSVQFISGDTQVMIGTNGRHDEIGRGSFGVTLDVVFMSEVDWFSAPGDFTRGSQVTGFNTETRIVTSHESTLCDINLQDRHVQPYSQSKQGCDFQCKKPDPYSSADSERVGYTNPRGLNYQLRNHPGSEGIKHSIVLTVTGPDGQSKKSLSVPHLSGPQHQGEHFSGKLLQNPMRLMVTSASLLLVWTLPKTFDEEFVLSLAHKVENCSWHTCRHQRIYRTRQGVEKSKVKVVHLDRVFTKDTESDFLEGLLMLISMYGGHDTDSALKWQILQYARKHFNTSPGDAHVSVHYHICWNWSVPVHELYKDFITEILDPRRHDAKWTPRVDQLETSPLSLILEISEKQPIAIEIGMVIIAYCIYQAKKDKNPAYLHPILGCLSSLTDPSNPIPSWH
ncbi:hypothetical protein BGX33_005191 [Mortierella sp. NVP41]|nr:hypothetical protein BGX33_005191 [Mortierella sp. NVP41]